MIIHHTDCQTKQQVISSLQFNQQINKENIDVTGITYHNSLTSDDTKWSTDDMFWPWIRYEEIALKETMNNADTLCMDM